MNTMNHRITLQSRKMFLDALLRLMQAEDYSQITVKQLCLEADLSRRTFYRLYKAKEDVLSEYLLTLTEHFRNVVTETNLQHYSEVAAAYFNFWKEHSDFLCLLNRNGLFDMLNSTVGNAALSVFQIVKPNIETNDTVLEFALSYSIGGLNGMLEKWVENNMMLSPAQLTDILEKALNIASY